MKDVLSASAQLLEGQVPASARFLHGVWDSDIPCRSLQGPVSTNKARGCFAEGWPFDQLMSNIRSEMA